MATYSRILAWKISWAEEPRGLQSMRLQSQTLLKGLNMPTDIQSTKVEKLWLRITAPNLSLFVFLFKFSLF